jgi:2-methylisocitrate lyase-like PEP mutase family enzyme
VLIISVHGVVAALGMRPSPIEAGFKVIDANGQGVAYVYGHADKRDAETANGLTLDEARRIASNIAKLKHC